MTSETRVGWAKRALIATAFAAMGAGCIVEHDHSAPYYGPPNVQFDPVRNLDAYCSSGMTSWTVTNRETGDTGTARCEEPITFTDLYPNASYTFDVTGYAGQRLCWQGACGVSTLGSGTAFADCSAEIAHLCGF